MTQQEIHIHLDGMLSNPKTKNFINHLIRAYFPVSNIEKVFDRPTGAFKCVITGDELFSFQDLLEGTQTEEFKDGVFSNLGNLFDGKDVDSPLVKLINGRKMGVTGSNTTTYM